MLLDLRLGVRSAQASRRPYKISLHLGGAMWEPMIGSRGTFPLVHQNNLKPIKLHHTEKPDVDTCHNLIGPKVDSVSLPTQLYKLPSQQSYQQPENIFIYLGK